MKAKHFKSRHALLMSLTSLMLCVSMLFGATFAWFTDSVTSGVNRIVSGNLDVELYHQNAETPRTRVTTGTNDLFNAAIDNHHLWEPGAVSYETFTIANEGNLALKYLFSLAQITNYNTVTWADNIYSGAGDLTDVIKVAITEGTISGRDDALALFGADKTTYSLSKDADVALQTAALGAGLEKTFTVVFYWEPNTGAIDNRYNLRAIDGTDKWTLDNGSELYIGVGVNLVATQYTNESDSFGIDYDAGANQDWTVTTGVIAQAKVSNQAANEELTMSNNGTTVEIAAGDVAAAETTSLPDEDGKTTTTNVEYSMAVEVTDTNTAATPIIVNDDQSVTYLDIDVTKTTTTTVKDSVNTVLSSNTESTSTFANVVKVNRNIGSGKTGVIVYHNGIAMDLRGADNTVEEGYYYNASTGILTIWSKSFSPFALVNDKPVEPVTGDIVVTVNGETTAYNAIDYTDGLGSAFDAAMDFAFIDRTATDMVKVKVMSDITFKDNAGFYWNSGHEDDIPTVTLDINGHNLVFNHPLDVYDGSAFGAVTLHNGNLLITDSAGNGKIEANGAYLSTFNHYGNDHYIVDGATIICNYTGTWGGSKSTGWPFTFNGSAETVPKVQFINGTFSYDLGFDVRVATAENPVTVGEKYSNYPARYTSYAGQGVTADTPAGIFEYIEKGAIPATSNWVDNQDGTFTVTANS